MPEEDCACGLKYKTAGQLVAGVQLALGLSLIITGFATIDYDCDFLDEYGNYDYDCWNDNWVSWCVAIGGCVCMTAGSLLLYGVRNTRPSGLMIYVVVAAVSTINYSSATVLAICYDMDVIFVVLLFLTAFWFLFTVVFVFKYRKLMISQLPATQVFLATPYMYGGPYPSAPAQPGVYPAAVDSMGYIVPPGAYPGNMNPYPGHFDQPPPYYASAQPPSSAYPKEAAPPYQTSSVDPPYYSA